MLTSVNCTVLQSRITTDLNFYLKESGTRFDTKAAYLFLKSAYCFESAHCLMNSFFPFHINTNFLFVFNLLQLSYLAFILYFT